MTNELIALANGREMGSVIYRNARLSFIYEESWRQDGRSYPLSLSMPLAWPSTAIRGSNGFYGVCCPTMTASSKIGRNDFTSLRGMRFD
jgi:hypothetical protein